MVHVIFESPMRRARLDLFLFKFNCQVMYLFDNPEIEKMRDLTKLGC